MSFLNRYRTWLSESGCVFLDLRSAEAYEKGHIPESLSVPLFDSLEMRLVRSMRKRASDRNSLHNTVSEWLGRISGIDASQPLVLVCADGVIRSQFAWDSLKVSHEVYILKGGYRSYKREVRGILTRKYRFIILAGKTGCGKTAMLQRLKEAGEQVLDIEMLAGSSGSVFGQIGRDRPQPSQEQFENNLAEILINTNVEKPIFAEQEHDYIGKCQIPSGLLEQFASSPRILLNLPFQQRVKLLTETYAGVNDEAMIKGISSLHTRLGKDESEALAAMVRRREYSEVAARLLEYYDNADSYRLVSGDHDVITNGENLDSLYDAIQMTKKNASPK